MVVDDHDFLREATISLIKYFPDFEVIGQAANGKEALAFLEDHQPDVILLDVEMPIMNGKETLAAITKAYPLIKVIMLTMYEGTGYEIEYMNMGAHAFLTKNTQSEDVFRIIKSVMKGRYYYSAEAQDIHIAAIFGKHAQLSLTEREREIVTLVCNDKTNRQIAQTLNLSENTIRFYRKNIYSKTKTSSIAELVKYAIRNGIVKLD